MDSGNAPLLLPKNQLAFALNTTVRGAYATHRPPFSKQTLNFGGDAAMEASFKNGLFQGAMQTLYKPDVGVESAIVSISGHIYKLTPTAVDWTVADISIPGDYNDPNITQVWMWQAEKWIIVTDGTPKLPIFTDTVTSRRSIGNIEAELSITAVAPAFYPAVGGTVQIDLASAPSPQWPIGTPITGLFGEYVVTAWIDADTVEIQRISAIGPAAGGAWTIVPPAVNLIYAELPAGRMGVYGMFRVWMSLIDGKQFVAGDGVGGASGTLAHNFRDSVLHVVENTFLAGGGYFTTPGSWGDIRAMIFATTLDTSLGQGALQVMTPTRCFSVNSPPDRTTWAAIENPVLTESLISNGSESQWSTVNANGDIFMRAVDGIRSLILGRREFATWGNVPVSSEMDRVLTLDVEDLLIYSSAIVFDNRLLMTADPSPVEGHGVFHPGIVALNFDPLSNLRGKSPSVYDGLWTGLNVLQLLVGRISATERAFAFTYNLMPSEIEFYEILPTPTDVFTTNIWPTKESIYDNGQYPIVWAIESPVLFKEEESPIQLFHRWLDGEVVVDNMVGTVDFAAYYKSDQYPCWQPWFSWSECVAREAENSKPQFRPRMGLGEPHSGPCDPSTNRPMREGYSMQFKLIIQGHCRVLSMRFKAVTIPVASFAKQACVQPCNEVSVT